MVERMLYLRSAAVCCIFISQASASLDNQNKVLASRIESITLHNNQLTTGRRLSPIPQLQCIGGDAKDLFEVLSMRCRAQGTAYDTNDIQWTCTSDLPDDFKLGSTQVLCEGYDHPEDPYILKGSCGVEYRLMLTEKGVRRYGHRKDRDARPASGKGSNVGAFVFGAVFITVAYIIVSGMIRQWRLNRERQRRLPGADPGLDNGGRQLFPPHFDDDGEDPPPPYDDNDDGDRGQDHPAKKSSDKSPKVQASTDLRMPDAGVGSSSSGSTLQRQGTRLATGAAVVAGVGAGAAAAAHAYRSSTERQFADETRNQDVPRVRTTNVYMNNITRSQSWSSQSQESIGFGGTTRR